MKKKVIIIISIVAAVLLLAGLGVFLGIRQYRKGLTKHFVGTYYPVSCKVKNGKVIIKIKDKSENTEKIAWGVRIENEELITAVVKNGKLGSSKIEVTVNPAKTGKTDISFVKSIEVAGETLDVINITLPIYVEESANGLYAGVQDGVFLEKGRDVVGADTEFPVMFNNALRCDSVLSPDSGTYYNSITFKYDEDTADILFPNGQNDWKLECASGAYFMFFDMDKGTVGYIHKEEPFHDVDKDYPNKSGDVVHVSTYTDSTATDALTEFTVTSESLGITEKFSLSFDENENAMITRVVSEKKK